MWRTAFGIPACGMHTQQSAEWSKQQNKTHQQFLTQFQVLFVKRIIKKSVFENGENMIVSAAILCWLLYKIYYYYENNNYVHLSAPLLK